MTSTCFFCGDTIDRDGNRNIVSILRRLPMYTNRYRSEIIESLVRCDVFGKRQVTDILTNKCTLIYMFRTCDMTSLPIHRCPWIFDAFRHHLRSRVRVDVTLNNAFRTRQRHVRALLTIFLLPQLLDKNVVDIVASYFSEIHEMTGNVLKSSFAQCIQNYEPHAPVKI